MTAKFNTSAEALKALTDLGQPYLDAAAAQDPTKLLEIAKQQHDIVQTYLTLLERESHDKQQ